MDARADEVVAVAVERPEARLEIGEPRAEGHGLLELLDGVGPAPRVDVGLGERGVHVRELAAHERILERAAAAVVAPDAGVDAARGVVLAEIVVGDGEVEEGLGVAGVELDRALEVALCAVEIASIVEDDRHHVVDVGVPIRDREDLPEQGLGAIVLATLVVLAPEREELLHLLIHGRRLNLCARGVDRIRRP